MKPTPVSLLPGLGLALLLPVAAAAQEAEQFVGASDDSDAQASFEAAPSNAADGERRNADRPSGVAKWANIGGHALVGGDMLIGKVDADGQLINQTSLRGFGHSRLLDRWPDGIVPFELDDSISAEQRSNIRAAIEHWMENTRMTFVESGTERADQYEGGIRFIAQGGCASFVGRHPDQPQPVYVQNCTIGSVIHEIGHAVGLYHEHTRPDRDNFIEIKQDNIVPAADINFEIQFTNAQTQGEYDYDSIMHYGPRFFSRNGQDTIKAPDGHAIGQRVGLSDGDIAAVNRMYATDMALGVESRERDVALADGTQIQGLEIDVTVRNMGSLGAHDLTLAFDIGERARWLSVSENSGWDCTTTDATLNCLRDTFAEGETSSFVLHVDPQGATAADLSARLDSRTQDLDPNNNALNDGEGEALPTVAAANPKDEMTQTRDSSGDGNDASGSSGSSTKAETGSSGGAAGWSLLLLGLAGLARRSRSGGKRHS